MKISTRSQGADKSSLTGELAPYAGQDAPATNLFLPFRFSLLPIPRLTAHEATRAIYQIHAFARHIVTFHFSYIRFNHAIPSEPLPRSSFCDYWKQVSVLGQAVLSHIK